MSVTNPILNANFKFTQMPRKFELTAYVRSERSDKNLKITLAKKKLFNWPDPEVFMTVSNTPRFTIAYRVP